MYFDFEDYHPDITPVGRAISWREGVLLSIIVHLLGVIAAIMAPRLFPVDMDAVRARRAALQARRDAQEAPRFVFVQPQADVKALKPPPRAEPSDQDREARSPQRAKEPANSLPYSRGNSSERVERAPNEVARGQGPSPEPAAGEPKIGRAHV